MSRKLIALEIMLKNLDKNVDHENRALSRRIRLLRERTQSLSTRAANKLQQLKTFARHFSEYESLVGWLRQWMQQAEEGKPTKAEMAAAEGAFARAAAAFHSALSAAAPVADEETQRALHAQFEQRFKQLMGRLREENEEDIEDDGRPLGEVVAEVRVKMEGLDEVSGGRLEVTSEEEALAQMQKQLALKEAVHSQIGKLRRAAERQKPSGEQASDIGTLLDLARTCSDRVGRSIDGLEAAAEALRGLRGERRSKDAMVSELEELASVARDQAATGREGAKTCEQMTLVSEKVHIVIEEERSIEKVQLVDFCSCNFIPG